jgi:hypothetical protein
MTKILVTSPKGGVGKSTLCFQFLAPYLFNRDNKKLKIIDLDNANSEAKIFTKSNLFSPETNNINSIDPLIAVSDENIIIDSGATTLAKETIEKIDEINLIESIDLFCIPMTRGKQANASALKMYDIINELKPDAKICFVLSDCYDEDEVPLEMQFVKFLGDKKHMVSAKIEKEIGDFDKLKEKDPDVSWITVPSSPCIYWVSEYGMTAYEFAEKLQTLEQKQKDLAKEVSQNPDKKTDYMASTYKVVLAKKCRNFRKKVLEEKFFNEFKVILGD